MEQNNPKCTSVCVYEQELACVRSQYTDIQENSMSVRVTHADENRTGWKRRRGILKSKTLLMTVDKRVSKMKVDKLFLLIIECYCKTTQVTHDESLSHHLCIFSQADCLWDKIGIKSDHRSHQSRHNKVLRSEPLTWQIPTYLNITTHTHRVKVY